MSSAVMETNLPGFSVEQGNFRRGKVRDIYDLGKQLLIVSTDRISAFDWVLPNGIPDKGRVLNQLSCFWFDRLGKQITGVHSDREKIDFDLSDGEFTHLMSDQVKNMRLPEGANAAELEGRTMLAIKCQPILIECVVRGYIDGSGWKEYQKTGTVCGITLPPGLKRCEKLAEPIFTPATKEEMDHDINISFEEMCRRVGQERSEELRDRSIKLYQQGAEFAASRGILIADTKFEWGIRKDNLVLIDEVLTPDSSRFWPADLYEPGHAQPSFDKQFVRDYLEEIGWDKNSPPPELPDEIVQQTRDKYIEAYERLTQQVFPWK